MTKWSLTCCSSLWQVARREHTSGGTCLSWNHSLIIIVGRASGGRTAYTCWRWTRLRGIWLFCQFSLLCLEESEEANGWLAPLELLICSILHPVQNGKTKLLFSAFSTCESCNLRKLEYVRKGTFFNCHHSWRLSGRLYMYCLYTWSLYSYLILGNCHDHPHSVSWTRISPTQFRKIW